MPEDDLIVARLRLELGKLIQVPRHEGAIPEAIARAFLPFEK